jgi:hypothetical protein
MSQVRGEGCWGVSGDRDGTEGEVGGDLCSGGYGESAAGLYELIDVGKTPLSDSSSTVQIASESRMEVNGLASKSPKIGTV